MNPHAVLTIERDGAKLYQRIVNDYQEIALRIVPTTHGCGLALIFPEQLGAALNLHGCTFIVERFNHDHPNPSRD